MVGHQIIWEYAHGSAVLFGALLFTAGFLCTLLWTNNIVPTSSSVADPVTSTLTPISPPVQTFTLSYGVALFGVVWNSVLYVTLVILRSDTLPHLTPRLRYDLEKAACTITAVGNAIYAIACIALMTVLARLAGSAPDGPSDLSKDASLRAADGLSERQAGQGVTAAMAGLAAATAVWACLMDAVHMTYSPHRATVKNDMVPGGEEDGVKQA